MNQEENKKLVNDLTAAFNQGRLDNLVGNVMDPEMAYIHGNQTDGAQDWIQASKDCRVSFPDAHLEVKAQSAEGDLVTTEYAFTGTHRGPFGNVAPSGKSFNVSIKTVSRIAGGMIVAIDEVVDYPAMMQQLGLAMAGN